MLDNYIGSAEPFLLGSAKLPCHCFVAFEKRARNLDEVYIGRKDGIRVSTNLSLDNLTGRKFEKRAYEKRGGRYSHIF